MAYTLEKPEFTEASEQVRARIFLSEFKNHGVASRFGRNRADRTR
jgi:hypothetical protein